MSNKRFEMFEFRAALIRMRHGDSDRAIARSGRLSSHIWPVSVKMTGRKRIGLEPARRPRTDPPRIGTTDSGTALHIGTVINSGRIRYFTYHLRIQ